MGRTEKSATNNSGRDITVLVAIYKAGQFIDSKIKNLREQTIFNNVNIVLLNCQNLDGEHEKYQKFLHENDNVTEIAYDKHIRLYPTWNDGIKATDSEFICNANVDDFWHPEYLEKCIQFLRENKIFCCVSSQILITDIPNQFDHSQWKSHDRLPVIAYPQSTAGPCPVWRRSLHTKYGYFGNYRTIGDARMWEKWYAGGEKFGLLEQDLVLYYLTENSLERRIDREKNKSYRDLDLEDDKCVDNQ